MAMTHDIINILKNIWGKILRTLKNGIKFSFYSVNLLKFYRKVGTFLTFFFLILGNTFYLHINNIILILGEAVLKSKMKKLH